MLQVENLEFQLAAANASVEHSRSHNAALQARIRCDRRKQTNKQRNKETRRLRSCSRSVGFAVPAIHRNRRSAARPFVPSHALQARIDEMQADMGETAKLAECAQSLPSP
jgi:hypothetical protein